MFVSTKGVLRVVGLTYKKGCGESVRGPEEGEQREAAAAGHRRDCSGSDSPITLPNQNTRRENSVQKGCVSHHQLSRWCYRRQGEDKGKEKT